MWIREGEPPGEPLFILMRIWEGEPPGEPLFINLGDKAGYEAKINKHINLYLEWRTSG